jgi:hypothetical protein
MPVQSPKSSPNRLPVARARYDGGYVSHVSLPVVMCVGVFIVVVAVLAIRLAYGATPEEVKPPVLVLGDSITDHGQRELRDTLGPMYALSIEGQDNFRIDDLLPVAERWATRDFVQVVINLGANDVVQGWPVDESADGLERLVELFPEARCIHLTTLSEELPTRSPSAEGNAASLNETMRRLSAEDRRVRVVDWNRIVSDARESGTDLTSDGVHPTSEGQRLLVAAVERSTLACGGS